MNPIQDYEYGKSRQTRTITISSGLTGVAKFLGGTMAQNNCIYYTPARATRVLKFDPATEISTSIGTTFTATANHKWNGGVLYSDGKIYAFPQSESGFQNVLVIDPATDSTALISIGATGIGCPCLGSDGYIYGPPLNGGRVYKFNPATSTGVFVGSTYANTSTWYSGVLANNNKIYFAPTLAGQVLELDIATGNTALIGTDYGLGTSKYVSGQLALNGNIYFAPYNATQFLELNVTTLTTTLVGSTHAGSSKYFTCLMGLNGKIYGSPFDAEKTIELNVSSLSTKLIGSNYSTAAGKWVGLNLYTGKIYCGPYNSNLYLNIVGVGTPNLVGSDANIPSPISGIATSNYNKYYNKF